jgi:hypothetical protein
MVRDATQAGAWAKGVPGSARDGVVPYPGRVLTQMRDRTGGPRARYRLLALLLVLGMLLAAAPLLVPIISSLVAGLNG